ncbi:MAG TPA: hypothetical protein VGF60_23125 [Xanthobacteraceae bacterium]
MGAEVSAAGSLDDASGGRVTSAPGALLRAFAVAAGLSCAVLFVVIGLLYRLQMYADGSIFSYAVAVDDAWAFHWHNISGRLFVYLFSYVPAQLYVRLTADAGGGIVLYGLLFFAAPLLGLVATCAADRSPCRVIFSYACASTACLCPLVFGFPTEMWMAHALFWPTLAICHYGPRGIGGSILLFLLLLALLFTHEAAVVLAVSLVGTLLLRRDRDSRLAGAVCMLAAVGCIWAAVRLVLPPDDYMAAVMRRAALHVFDPAIMGRPLPVLLVATLAGYAIGLRALRRLAPKNAFLYAGFGIAAALVVHWSWLDRALHAEDRYYLRTALILALPVLGALATVQDLAADGRLRPLPGWLRRPTAALETPAAARAVIGALGLVLLVHAVETAKYVNAWSRYTRAVRALAMGAASDPALGDPRFVSSRRISADLNRVSWFSTTPFLSVLVAPAFAPARLVVDPDASFFWLSCRTATASAERSAAIPAESRRLVQRYSCLHRPG